VQWNSGSKTYGTTFCGQRTEFLALTAEGEGPTCKDCQREMRRERFRARHHEVYKLDYENGSYQIFERWKHNGGLCEDVIARFEKREDRDMIYEAMRLGGYCGHATKSWIRSIPPLKKDRRIIGILR